MQNPFFESQAVEQARVLASKDPVISTDGRFVAYSGQNEAYGWDVYVYDRQSGQTELISKALEGVSDGVNWWPAISGDGRWVALWSWAGNLVADDLEVCRQGERNNYSCGDVFIYDRETGQMDRIPVGMGYGIGMGEETLSLSENGSRVRYLCKVYDRQMDQFLCEDCCNAKLSGNGLFSIFRKGVEFFVKDLSTGAVTMVSVTSDGVPSNGEWVGFSDPEYALWHEAMFEPGCDISNDGQWAVFASPASNLDLDDTYVCSDWPFVSHNCYDVFIHNLVTGITEWISKPYK